MKKDKKPLETLSPERRKFLKQLLQRTLAVGAAIYTTQLGTAFGEVVVGQRKIIERDFSESQEQQQGGISESGRTDDGGVYQDSIPPYIP